MTVSSGAHSRRILVTGASGFVGAWLMPALRAIAPDAEIFGASHLPASLPPDVEFVGFDIRSADEVDAAIRKVSPTAVLHLAAMSAPSEAHRDPRLTWDVNVMGTFNVAKAIVDNRMDARFVYVGTADVYGGTFRKAGRPLDEGAALDPLNVYAASKAAADIMVGQMAHEGLRALRLRPFNHTGPGQTEKFVVPAFAAQVARIEAGLQDPVIRVGNLDAGRDFLDVRDVVEAYAAALLAPQDFTEPGTILHLASGQARRIGDILEFFLSQARTTVRVEEDPARMRPSDTPIAMGDASRAGELLGWKPQIPFETTLADVLQFWRTEVAGEPAERERLER